jgi:hypothetical protein
LTLLNISSATAFDPFRLSTESRVLSEPAVAAFQAMFEQGNYQNAQWYLQQAQSEESQEPDGLWNVSCIGLSTGDLASFSGL